jgi:aspartate kinase
MLVFKFGGASIKNAEAVKQVGKIVRQYSDSIIIVISAMAKNTNALEKLAATYFNSQHNSKNKHEGLGNSTDGFDSVYQQYKLIKEFHFNIVNDLFSNSNHAIFIELTKLFDRLLTRLKTEPSLNFNFEYDQIVSFGEIVSTKIISAYLNETSLQNKWIDIRKSLKTDNVYREAGVNWKLSEKLMKKVFLFNKQNLYITQGFIGSTINNMTTTLGREGSDFTASAIAYIMDAEKVITWKDVPGIFSADPAVYKNPEKLEEISYKEAIELSFFGAKVIHPKTIKPLQNKKIPLYVKSFISPKESGTIINGSKNTNRGVLSKKQIPIYIFKKNQRLISISPYDFSFIVEENLSRIFKLFAKYRTKINLMQNSAISFSVCIDDDENKLLPLIDELQQKFKVLYNNNLELITIQSYTEKAIKQITEGRTILVQQKSRHTARFVMKM